MKNSGIILPLYILSILSVCQAANQTVPHVGYIYPAGGQQGTSFYVVAGGQFLRGSKNVDISGNGVKGRVVKYYKPIINLNKDERQLLQTKMQEVRDKRLIELGVDPNSITQRKPVERPKTLDSLSPEQKQKEAENKTKKTGVKMPQHPLFEDLENKSLRELAHIQEVIFASRSKKQRNRQLAEMVLIRVSIDSKAKPGTRELRIQSRLGLTNPINFQIDQLPEVKELEPNDENANPRLQQYARFLKNIDIPREKPIELPVILNGQILPGDVDRFRFKAQEGQNLVIETYARKLIPYLADAVPGWFQAVVSLYDEKGNEVAFADDYRFNPDPVLLYKIPKTGEYELQINDSIYRGREDFVYRISISQRPFITQMFPLSGKTAIDTVASIKGWNLAKATLPLDTRRSREDIRELTCQNDSLISDPLTYIVNQLPNCTAKEPNDTIKTAQKINLPVIVNGLIDKPGDIDVFEFAGKSGDKITAEVYARRLNSPVDSLIQLTDSTGKVIELNDDYIVKEGDLYKDISGLVTHHADSYLTTALPANGTYYLHIADTQHHGGSQYAYCLRVGPPQPDYELRMTPSSLSVRNGGIVPFCVYALRKDGFDGEINIVLKNNHLDFKLAGSRIPPGCDRIYMTLEAPMKKYSKPLSLELVGIAIIDDKIVRHDVVPAEDTMQAFLYRHLVTYQELKVAVQKTRWKIEPLELIGYTPSQIKAGDSVYIYIRLKSPRRKAIEKIELELLESPEGVSISDSTFIPEGFAFRILTDKNEIEKDITKNLIVEAYAKLKPGSEKAESKRKIQRIPLGTLPAIPVEITKPKNLQVSSHL